MTLHHLHNFLFWILTACFIAVTSSVLFFTFGYRFSFDRGIFVYTGSIMIKSNPRDVAVIIDGERIPERRTDTVNQTIHIPGLDPGEHLLRVEAEGFYPWEKKVTVQSGVSTEFWNIILTRQDYERTTLLSGPIRKTFFSHLERKFAIAETSPGGGVRISILDQEKTASEQIFEHDGFIFEPDADENIEWSPDGSELLVPLRDRETSEHTVLVVDIRTGQGTDLREYSDLSGPHDARWNPVDNRSFFVLSGTSLFLVHTKERETTKRSEVLADSVPTYDLSGRTLFLLRSGSDEIFETALDGWSIRPEPIPGTIPGIGALERPKLTVYDRKRVAVYERGGYGFLLNDDGGFAAEIISLGHGIRGVQFSDDGKKLLFFTDNELSVAFTHEWDMQPYRKSGEVIQIARFSSPISHPQWAKDYEYVLFTIDHELKMAELDHRDRRNITTIAAFPDRVISQVLPDFGKWLIYQLVTGQDGTASFMSLPFPEQPGIFGS